MPAIVLVGAQWGDEGKGKVVDLLTEHAQVVVRFHGGNNAGHTLVVGGQKTVLHLIPSGILHAGKTCVIGNGCVVDPLVLMSEVDQLRARGLTIGPEQLMVSEHAHVICPWHKHLDLLREKAAGSAAIGTTGRGIGPCYEDKVARRGVRVRELLDVERLRRRVKERLPSVVDELASLARQTRAEEPLLDAERMVSELALLGGRMKELVGDTALFLAEHVRKGTRVLFEGAQGTLLDVDHGTYPYVTSSNTVAGNAAVGSGIGPTNLDRVMGISKAYTTRVGGGPFPTELDDAVGERLRRVGSEFGATTGRPRRCGWLDTVVLRYAVRTNGLWGLALTKMDVLSGIDPLRVCTAYELDGRRVTELPSELDELLRVKPIYEELPGWGEDLAGARTIDDLPVNARRYVRRIEEMCGVPVVCISVGAERGETILLKNPFWG